MYGVLLINFFAAGDRDGAVNHILGSIRWVLDTYDWQKRFTQLVPGDHQTPGELGFGVT